MSGLVIDVVREAISLRGCFMQPLLGLSPPICLAGNRANGERVKLAVILVAVTFLVIILLVIIAFAITMCWKP